MMLSVMEDGQLHAERGSAFSGRWKVFSRKKKKRKASCMVVEAVAAEIVGRANPGEKRDMGREVALGRRLEIFGGRELH